VSTKEQEEDEKEIKEKRIKGKFDVVVDFPQCLRCHGFLEQVFISPVNFATPSELLSCVKCGRQYRLKQIEG